MADALETAGRANLAWMTGGLSELFGGSLFGGRDEEAWKAAQRAQARNVSKTTTRKGLLGMVDAIIAGKLDPLFEKRDDLLAKGAYQPGPYGTSNPQSSRFPLYVDYVGVQNAIKNVDPDTLIPQEERLDQAEQDALDYYFDDFNRQREQGQRDMTFELARRGTLGGSAEIDAGREFQRREDRGREQIGLKGLEARDRLKTFDENLRTKLSDMVLQGSGRQSVLDNAYNSLTSNITNAANQAKGDALDNIFLTAGNLFNNASYAQGLNQGRDRVRSLFSGGRPLLQQSSGSKGNIYSIT